MVASQPEESELPQVVNLSGVSVENVEAELVRTNQTGIQHLNAEEVELHISALGMANTGNLQARDSMLGVVVRAYPNNPAALNATRPQAK
jgi:hypothetical protein